MSFEKLIDKPDKWQLTKLLITGAISKNVGELDSDGDSKQIDKPITMTLEQLLEYANHESKDDKAKLKDLRQDKKALQARIDELEAEEVKRKDKIKKLKAKAK